MRQASSKLVVCDNIIGIFKVETGVNFMHNSLEISGPGYEVKGMPVLYDMSAIVLRGILGTGSSEKDPCSTVILIDMDITPVQWNWSLPFNVQCDQRYLQTTA
jgi:hypothetical protein